MSPSFLKVVGEKLGTQELWPNLGDDDLRKAAYRGGWKPA
jgi:hypothetical protein